MTLDEAIKHCEAVIEKKNEELAFYHSRKMHEYIPACHKYVKEHEQLAEWLKDYKRLLEWEKDIKGKVYRNEHCDRAGKCIDYIGYHCTGCNSADMRGDTK